MNMTMVGRLTDCILLTYRSPAKSVEHLIPDGLALVTHAGQSFWNIVACHVIRMRPSGTPSALGLTYTHVAYRLYVHTTGTAQRMTGLYFVRSDVDNRLVGAAGNWLTDFRFNTSRIDYTVEDGIALSVTASDGNANASLLAAPMDRFSLSRDSCFDTIQQAMATLKYQPTALSVGKHSFRCSDVSRKE